MGSWLKAGKYSFGEIKLVKELNEDEDKEYKESEQKIYDMWYEQFSSDIEADQRL